MNETWYLDGKICAFQPKNGYRAGTDSLLLAQSLNLKSGAKVLELGTGSALAMLIANHNCPNCHFTGLDNSADMLALARKNTHDFENISIESGNVGAIPKAWHLQFDHVFANPPYFDTAKSVRMSDAKAPSFVTDDAKLADWIAAMLITLKPRGTATLIYRADGLEHILSALVNKAGRIRILPIHSFADAPAKRVIVQFRKGVKSESALLPALILHERGATAKFTAKTQEILAGKRSLIL
ncbi:MAG: methyltransferase [Robiginitomaculum sp.]|nr:MAG: methyltransferase [Robiginitomaculum sp.]